MVEHSFVNPVLFEMARSKAGLLKRAFIPPTDPALQDPSLMGAAPPAGAPPMDPAMMAAMGGMGGGGGMPPGMPPMMDPAMMGGAGGGMPPLDPALLAALSGGAGASVPPLEASAPSGPSPGLTRDDVKAVLQEVLSGGQQGQASGASGNRGARKAKVDLEGELSQMKLFLAKVVDGLSEMLGRPLLSASDMAKLSQPREEPAEEKEAPAASAAAPPSPQEIGQNFFPPLGPLEGFGADVGKQASADRRALELDALRLVKRARRVQANGTGG